MLILQVGDAAGFPGEPRQPGSSSRPPRERSELGCTGSCPRHSKSLAAKSPDEDGDPGLISVLPRSLFRCCAAVHPVAEGSPGRPEQGGVQPWWTSTPCPRTLTCGTLQSPSCCCMGCSDSGSAQSPGK